MSDTKNWAVSVVLIRQGWLATDLVNMLYKIPAQNSDEAYGIGVQDSLRTYPNYTVFSVCILEA